MCSGYFPLPYYVVAMWFWWFKCLDLQYLAAIWVSQEHTIRGWPTLTTGMNEMCSQQCTVQNFWWMDMEEVGSDLERSWLCLQAIFVSERDIVKTNTMDLPISLFFLVIWAHKLKVNWCWLFLYTLLKVSSEKELSLHVSWILLCGNA